MYITLDIGATNTRIASSPSINDVTLLDKKTIPTPQNFDKATVEITKHIKQITEQPKSIGVGLAGKIREDTTITEAINLLDWMDKSIKRSLAEQFTCSIHSENDAVAQALAEAYYGDTQKKHFLYLTWGTGLGGALVTQNGKTYTATIIDKKHLTEWEQKISGKHIEQRFGKQAQELNEQQWQRIVADLYQTIKTVAQTLDMDYVLLGGGIVEKQKELLIKNIHTVENIEVTCSTMGEDIGLYGGLALIRKSLTQG